ncbi:sensor histidine kinase [Undibacterium sp. Di27W]|uniref:sensor histidine kinase n=1 Tax=Undibacterium sp. Di27W TaxID=3413036 RepID=UPI003BF0EDA2
MSATTRMRTALHTSEQLLPAEVAAKSETWLTRARSYPVFSRTWFRYRAQAWLGLFAIVDLLVVLVSLLIGADLSKAAVAFVPLTVGGTALHLIGPASAVWVRNQAYASKKEAILLALALLLGGAVSYGIFSGSNYLTKYVVSGGKDVSFAIGGSITATDKYDKSDKAEQKNAAPAASVNQSPISANSANEARPEIKKIEQSAALKAILQAFSLLMAFAIVAYTGGAVDLWYFFRQKKRLIEAMRQQELSAAQEARREAELRLSVLAAQVEPHFLFNTLAGVRSAILTEPQRATAIVDHLVDYLRATIPQMRSDGSSAQARLKQQLEAASAYLGLMQARIPRLSYSVDSEVSDAALPPLMLISLVENAVKHGVEPKVGAVHVAVHAKKIQQDSVDMLELTVADNGVGFAATSSGTGIGLANIHERLASMYGARASLVLKARADGGVAATILLPLEA